MYTEENKKQFTKRLIVCRLPTHFYISSSKSRDQKTIESNKFMDGFLQRQSQMKTIEILVEKKGRKCNVKQRKYSAFVVNETKKTHITFTELRMQRCNTHWSLNTCADYITQFMRSYHVYSNNL